MKNPLWAFALLTMCISATSSQAQPGRSLISRVIISPQGDVAQINATGQSVGLTVPLMDGPLYLGDVTVTLEADGQISFSAERLLDLIGTRVSASVIAQLRDRITGQGDLIASDMPNMGLTLRYDPQALQLEIEVSAANRANRNISVMEGDGRGPVSYLAPSNYSAYLNIRGSLDWVEQGIDRGLAAPITYFDGAIRIQDFVLEGEANWQSGAREADFQRRGTRIIYDDSSKLMRWTAGDLQTIARGFQSAPEISGLSLSRVYSALDPQRVIQPRGNRSFQLNRRSVVEVLVNGQMVRRMEMEPGTFNLQDFPFTQGANDIRLNITDDSGLTESYNFGMFLDQSQLAKGLSEFGFYAGVLAPLGMAGPVYSNDLAFSGFYRRGLSDELTLGANAQGDARGQMGGIEAVVSTPLGSLGGFVSGSQVDGLGTGWATIMTFQRTITRASGLADALSFSGEARSRNFSPINTFIPTNPYRYSAGVNYSRSITEALYASVDARYSKGRDAERSIGTLRTSGGLRISDRLNVTADLTYERAGAENRYSAFLSLIYRLKGNSTLRADYDNRDNRTRLTYQTYSGVGTGSYNFSADLERSDLGVGTTATGTYYGNRAELGITHFGTFEPNLSGSISQRTSFRFGTAIAVADGVVSIGRPIQDSFAIVHGHPALKGADILIDASGSYTAANTGKLGTAVQSNLISYSDRSLVVTVPDAPLGTDIGDGAYRLLPRYRSGYSLKVGSDYMISVVGRLLGEDGEAIALVAGEAIEVAQPNREPVPLFTNAAGRFGITGLAPGRWIITLHDDAKTQFEITIAEGAERTNNVGDIRPTQ